MSKIRNFVGLAAVAVVFLTWIAALAVVYGPGRTQVSPASIDIRQLQRLQRM